MTERNIVTERSFHLQYIAQKVVLLLTKLSWDEAYGKGTGCGELRESCSLSKMGAGLHMSCLLHSSKLHQSSTEQAGCCVCAVGEVTPRVLMERHRKDVCASDLHC